MDFNTNRYIIKEPKTKFSHYQQILQQVYAELKSLESRILNKIYFKFDDKQVQNIYNYCAGFAFDWNHLEKYLPKQINKYKKQDINYYNFLLQVQTYIKNERQYNQLKQDIENKFWEIKDKIKQPVKKEFQIWCTTWHTVDIQTKQFQWIFTIDNNHVIGGTKKKPKYDTMVIPVKYSDYHKKKLEGKTLKNTFNLKLNKYNKIEITGCYEVETDYPKPNPQEIIGIDIGLKKLITTSDGEIIEQNEKIVKRAKALVKNQSNRNSLEAHLKKKYNNDDYVLPNKNYTKKQNKLITFVKTDNRYRIKHFLQGKTDYQIVMEDLHIGYSKTHNKETNYLLRKMGIQNIKNDLIKYAKQYGISIKLVNDAFTSQQCPVCGYISKDNRKTQEMFCCVKCGHTDNADHNASVNIMNRSFDNRINLKTPIWRVKEILNIN